jgi:hypothetical protein
LVSCAWPIRAQNNENANSSSAKDLIRVAFSLVFASGSTFQPDCLPADGKTSMAKLLPSSRRCQPAHFGKRKRTPKRKAGVKTRHRLSKDQGSQQIDPGDSEITPFQISNHHSSPRDGPRMLQKPDRGVVCEMMERKRTEDKIHRASQRVLEDIRDSKCYLGIGMGFFHRQFESGRLKIDRSYLNADIVSSTPIDNEPWNITRPCTKIDYANGTTRAKPATKEI